MCIMRHVCMWMIMWMVQYAYIGNAENDIIVLSSINIILMVILISIVPQVRA